MDVTLSSLSNLVREEASSKKAMRDGVEIDKGAILTEEYLTKHKEFFKEMMTIFSAYPDIYLDIIKPVDSNFTLFF